MNKTCWGVLASKIDEGTRIGIYSRIRNKRMNNRLYWMITAMIMMEGRKVPNVDCRFLMQMRINWWIIMLTLWSWFNLVGSMQSRKVILRGWIIRGMKMRLDQIFSR